MNRADKRKISRAAVLSVLIGVFLSAILIWRELAHKNSLGERDTAYNVLQESFLRAQSDLEDAGTELERTANELSGMRINERSLQDRILNLEAQRDHLRADNENKMKHAKSLEAVVASLEKELSDANHRALELGSLPDKLRSELHVARDRLAELESKLDEQDRILAGIPLQYIFEGSSADNAAFALTGEPIPEQAMPWLMYLCNRDGLILEGWIHHINDGKLIGHAMNWHQLASALVKGEKVFMLPKKNHEKLN